MALTDKPKKTFGISFKLRSAKYLHPKRLQHFGHRIVVQLYLQENQLL